MKTRYPAVASKYLWQSLLAHFTLIIAIYILSWGWRSQKVRLDQVRIQVLETKSVPQPEDIQKPVAVQSQIVPRTKTKAPLAKPIFGLTQETLLSKKTEGAEVNVKLGNSLAKEIDQDKIDPSAAHGLPTPVEDYLVSEMPRVLSEFHLPYPEEAREKGIEGVAWLEILVDEEGKVAEANLVKDPGYGLGPAAEKAIYQFRFTPAKIDQRPVAVRFRFAYRFVLEK